MGTLRTRSYRLDRYRDQRRDKRLRAPVFCVYVDGRAYAADNWSLGGVRLVKYDGRLAADGAMQGVIAAETAEGPDFVRFDAQVLRFDPNDGSLALRFAAADEALTRFLERNIMRRLGPALRGR